MVNGTGKFQLSWLYPAIFRKDPWPKLGNNDRLKVKIDKKLMTYNITMRVKFILKMDFFLDSFLSIAKHKCHSDMGHCF